MTTVPQRLTVAPGGRLSRLASGIGTVAAQEFRLRIRAGRWRWLLTAWFVVLLAFTALLRAGLSAVEPHTNRGTTMYGGLMLFVLALALLVVPALSGQSVNGDRERGTLATLQVTRLTPAEIALGKFAAAWGTALVFLALTAPLVVWCMAEGGVPAVKILVVTLVIAALLGTVCAVSLALSALLARSTTSGLLSYVAVFALTIGTLVVFGLVTATTTQTRTVVQSQPVFAEPGPDGAPPAPAVPGVAPPVRPTSGVLPPDAVPGLVKTPMPLRYEDVRVRETQPRTDRTWWLLSPNPFVVLADAAPASPPRVRRLSDGSIAYVDNPLDPLAGIANLVRDLRRPPARSVGVSSLAPLPASAEAPPPGPPDPLYGSPPAPRGKRVWPTGLAVDILLGLGALVLATRRLRTPARTLPRGQRVA